MYEKRQSALNLQKREIHKPWKKYFGKKTSHILFLTLYLIKIDTNICKINLNKLIYKRLQNQNKILL